MASNPDFTVAEVLAWARTKPAGERYDYTDAKQCAVAQFGAETGRDELVGIPSTGLKQANEAVSWAVVANGDPSNWTFGKLVERLEARLPAAPADTWTKADAYLTDIETVESVA